MGNFERLKELADLKAYAEVLLQKSKGGFYCCPICGSGKSGKPGSDGALSITNDGTYWKCFSCGAGGDVFDLVGAVEGTDNKQEQLETVAALEGVTLEGSRPNVTVIKSAKPGRTPRKEPNHLEGLEKEEAYLARAREAFAEHPEAVAYWQARGFTEAEAAAWGIGYDATRKRIVLPWEGSTYYHIDRDTTDTQAAKYTKPKSEAVGRQPLYNPDALQAEAFFIVEGALDALAVKACGFEAVALGGTGSRQAVEDMRARGVSGVAVCLLDGDESGQKAQAELESALDAAGIVNLKAALPGSKDAAEALAADREALGAFLADAHGRAAARAAALQEAEHLRIMRSFRVLDPLDVATEIYTLAGAQEPIPTGLGGLDELLGGGLNAGLYVLGAVSSMGKTTLAVQIADAIAASGRGALFFTIEQSAKEIVSLSLSRYVARIAPKYAGMTAGEIRSPRARRTWGDAFNTALSDACDAYGREVAPNLGIQEGERQPSVSDVEAVARAWRRQHGESPVIFIDYLQLMAAPNERYDLKRAIDENVTQLRQLARKLRTPVVAISSLNRNSYNEGVTFDSFKESGAIEYGADVLLGLQPSGMDEKLDDTAAGKQRREGMKINRENKQATDRTCELKVLKNRYGRAEVKLALVFRTLCSTFEEKETRAQAVTRVL